MIEKKLLACLLTLILSLVSFTALASGTGGYPLTAKEQLGKKLFFDANLSTPKFQSCAICHNPEVGWTGPDSAINAGGAVYEGAVWGRFGNRKPPSSAYATLSPIFHYDEEEGLFVGGNFWDGRATGEHLGNPAADQALGPFLNPVEQNNPSPKAVCEKVAASQYAWLWKEAYGEPITCMTAAAVAKNYKRIGLAIAAYEGSSEVNQFSSKFDYYLKGRAPLTPQEKWGMDLFNGKAKCFACHPSEKSPNGEPPLFTDFTFDNLGVPKNPQNPFYRMDKVYLADGSPINPEGKYWVDPGLGGFLKSRTEWAGLASMNMGKHKVPTLRNVDKRTQEGFVKAFGHNGYFKSLKGIVHFYNTRDVKKKCYSGSYGDGTAVFTEAMALKNNCWPAPEVRDNVNMEELGNLGLSPAEEDALVAFMKTLSDGYNKPQTGQGYYDFYCTGCHGSADPADMYPAPVAPRKVVGARACSIKGGIYGTYVFKNGVKPMQFMKGAFSDAQMQMISDYLNYFPGITGQQRYTTTCAGCHGMDGKGGRVDEEVWGEEEKDIKEAIGDESPMRFLKCLPYQDIFSIGHYLTSGYYDDDDQDDDFKDSDDKEDD